IWFEQNPSRSHRVRLLLPGEADKEAAKTPAGLTLIVLVRQVEPGMRLKAGLWLNADLLPVPDNETIAHGLFEIGVGCEPIPSSLQAFQALFEKYTILQELQ